MILVNDRTTLPVLLPESYSISSINRTANVIGGVDKATPIVN